MAVLSHAWKSEMCMPLDPESHFWEFNFKKELDKNTKKGIQERSPQCYAKSPQLPFTKI